MIRTMGKKVIIQDIARAANVSITTVSHALSGKGRLPATTRERVRQTAERLGYRANSQARGLATGRSMTLAVQVAGSQSGILVPDFQYFVELLNAASARAIEKGYGLVLAPTGAGADGVRALALDGVIVVDPTGDELLLESHDAPLVTTGRVPGVQESGAWVDTDHRAGTRRVLDHFVESAGSSRPALLTTSSNQSYVEDITVAYRDWCSERGLNPIVRRVEGTPTETAASEAAVELLGGSCPPDAIYATFDRMALGVLLACREIGISVPDDLAVAALTDSPLLCSTSPQVTALDLDAPEIGRRAVDLLLGLIENEEGAQSSRRRLVPSTLVIRESTRPALL